VPTKELCLVAKSIADGMGVTRPKKKVLIKRVAKEARVSDRVIISCKCKGKCGNNRCRCFKEGKKCSVYCHDSSEHDYGHLASLAIRTEIIIKEKEKRKKANRKAGEKARKGGARKRQRANTQGDSVTVNV
jgi:hypothetical protein